MRCGVNPEVFWESNLRTTLQEIDGFIYRQELLQEQQMTSAWLTANWQRAKRMPNLRTVLNKIKGKRLPKPEITEQTKAEFNKMVEEMTGDLNIKPQE